MEDETPLYDYFVPESPEPFRRNSIALLREFNSYYGVRTCEYDDWQEVAKKSEMNVEYNPRPYAGTFTIRILSYDSRSFSYFQNYLSKLPEVNMYHGGKCALSQYDDKRVVYHLLFEGSYDLFTYFSRDFEKFIRIRFKPVPQMDFVINLI